MGQIRRKFSLREGLYSMPLEIIHLALFAAVVVIWAFIGRIVVRSHS
jgi:hypothetical protein